MRMSQAVGLPRSDRPGAQVRLHEGLLRYVLGSCASLMRESA